MQSTEEQIVDRVAWNEIETDRGPLDDPFPLDELGFSMAAVLAAGGEEDGKREMDRCHGREFLGFRKKWSGVDFIKRQKNYVLEDTSVFQTVVFPSSKRLKVFDTTVFLENVVFSKTERKLSSQTEPNIFQLFKKVPIHDQSK